MDLYAEALAEIDSLTAVEMDSLSTIEIPGPVFDELLGEVQ